MNNNPEQPTIPTEEPREVYTFTPTPDELATVNRALLGDGWKGILFAALFFGFLMLIAFLLSAPGFVCGGFLGALLTIELLLWVAHRNNKKALSDSMGKILANFASYRYEFYETYVTVICYRGEDMTRFQKVFYADLLPLRDTGEHILLQVNAVEYFLLRKCDLAPDARILALLAEQKQKTEQQVGKKSPVLRDVFFSLLAVVGFGVAMTCLDIFVEGAEPHPFPYSYIFVICAAFPLVTLVCGIISKLKSKKGGLLIGFGAAFLAILLLLGCLSSANPAMFDPYDHTATHLLYTEEKIGIDLPSDGYCKSRLWRVEEGYYFRETVVYLTEEEAAAFEENLASLPFKTGKDLTDLETSEGLYTSWYDGLDLTYYLYYNASAGEFNVAADPGETVRYFDLGYDPEKNALYILEYDMEFYAEDYWTE